ncbi:MAG: metallophosphoesterase [Chloroflexota bacterium]
MFDQSLLPPAQFEFIVISDTHYLDLGGQPIDEFKSRALQKDRIETALKLVASLDPSCVIHLGDLVMLYPARPEYGEMMAGAIKQIEDSGLTLHHVAGNCDVGDKHDTLSPVPPISPETLARYHAQFGSSWYSFEHAGHHFVVLNAQLMNAPFAEAEAQRNWLEADLADHENDRIFMFLHMPPYLWDEMEPSLGNYEIIDESDRGWLLDLIKQYKVEIVASGHIHFSFFDRIGPTRFHVLSSTSFGRDGFGYLFSTMPSERGRDDRPKIGFYLFRGYEQRTIAHFIRTNGLTSIPTPRHGDINYLITRTSPELPSGPLGITLKHLLAESTATPISWPSLVRRPIRNDYPLMGCVELGVKFIRVPHTDLADPLQSQRLSILRDEGVEIVAQSLWQDDVDLVKIIQQHLEQVDGWEVQLPGTLYPSAACLEAIKNCQRDWHLPITLSTIIPNQSLAEKYYPRTRMGYRIDELEGLDEYLVTHDSEIDRIICRIEAEQSPWEVIRSLVDVSLESVGIIDFAVELQTDDQVNASRVAEGLFAMGLMPKSRIYLEPLLDIDRMIDVSYGLLDTLCNPRPAFQVARCLNSILSEVWETKWSFIPSEIECNDITIRTLRHKREQLTLVAAMAPLEDEQIEQIFPSNGELTQLKVYHLAEATSTTTTPATLKQLLVSKALHGPVVVVNSNSLID